jgi:hypothetical protein
MFVFQINAKAMPGLPKTTPQTLSAADLKLLEKYADVGISISKSINDNASLQHQGKTAEVFARNLGIVVDTVYDPSNNRKTTDFSFGGDKDIDWCRKFDRIYSLITNQEVRDDIISKQPGRSKTSSNKLLDVQSKMLAAVLVYWEEKSEGKITLENGKVYFNDLETVVNGAYLTIGLLFGLATGTKSNVSSSIIIEKIKNGTFNKYFTEKFGIAANKSMDRLIGALYQVYLQSITPPKTSTPANSIFFTSEENIKPNTNSFQQGLYGQI